MLRDEVGKRRQGGTRQTNYYVFPRQNLRICLSSVPPLRPFLTAVAAHVRRSAESAQIHPHDSSAGVIGRLAEHEVPTENIAMRVVLREYGRVQRPAVPLNFAQKEVFRRTRMEALRKQPCSDGPGMASDIMGLIAHPTHGRTRPLMQCEPSLMKNGLVDMCCYSVRLVCWRAKAECAGGRGGARGACVEAFGDRRWGKCSRVGVRAPCVHDGPVTARALPGRPLANAKLSGLSVEEYATCRSERRPRRLLHLRVRAFWGGPEMRATLFRIPRRRL